MLEPPYLAEVHAIREELEKKQAGAQAADRIAERRDRVRAWLASVGYRLEATAQGERLRRA